MQQSPGSSSVVLSGVRFADGVETSAVGCGYVRVGGDSSPYNRRQDVRTSIDSEISDAWRDAGHDLGIRVTAPFVVTIEGDEVSLEALVSDFGGPMGTVAVSSLTACFRSILTQSGYFVSHLFPTYRAYSREHFIATLDDWQWFGPPEKAPPWYTGRPWS